MDDKTDAKPAKPDLSCDFCGTPGTEDNKLIRVAGFTPSHRTLDATICCECAALCMMALSAADRDKFNKEVAVLRGRPLLKLGAKPRDPS
jgi:hypothetical protein